jgi:large-conductance mechanosensitive channel
VPDVTADSVRARLGEPVASLRMRFDRQLFALSPRASRLLAILVIAASALVGAVMLRIVAATLVVPAAAQPQSQVRQVVCESGVPVDTLIAFTVAAISLFLLVKAVIQGTVAFNKLGSSRAQQQFEGKQALAGAGKTAAGAFVPPLFVGILGIVLGFDLGGCLLGSLDAGAILTAAASLPV